MPITSIDLNYRAKLWDIWGRHEVALEVLRRIVEHVDVIVGNEEDLQMGLGVAGLKWPPPVADQARSECFLRHGRPSD